MSGKTDKAPADEAVELVIPESLTELSDDELDGLHGQAVEAFNGVYGDGQSLSPADVETLRGLTEGIEALAGERAARAEAAGERAAEAAALAARVNPAGSDGGEDAGEEADADPSEDGDPDPDPIEGEDEGEAGSEGEDPDAVTASGRREIRVNVAALARGTARKAPTSGRAKTERDYLVASGEGTGYHEGQAIGWDDAARIVEHRLQGFNVAQYAAAAQAGRHVRQQNKVLTVRVPVAEDLTVKTSSAEEAMAVMGRAADETRLRGGSLVAAGGWCAPSEILYDLGCERESRDGLFSLPTIGIRRGGIQYTQGPDFSAIFEGTGFSFTEQEDIDGLYATDGGGAAVAGDKPCYRVPCPEFEEVRLNVSGLCITAGLLQQRGYPEVIARTVRGALVAHDHKMSANRLGAVIAGSTAVAMTAGQVGAAAPVLSTIELQVEHYRYAHRMARSSTLEAVFPFWARGVIRADLSRRLGVELLAVSDAQIDGWFRARGVSPQFVYGLDPLTGAATGATAWPTTLRFLLYAAGTWIAGTSDVITLDTIYDSVLLGQNDYTALFTEEGWLVAQRCPDSRIVSVPVCPDGATAAGVDIACNGTAETP